MNTHETARLEAFINGTLIEKAEADRLIAMEKDAGQIVRQYRMANQVPEGAVMQILKLDPSKPADQATYADFENGKMDVAFDGPALKALGKALKVDPMQLAAEMLSKDDSDAGDTDDANTDDAGTGDGTTPPADPATDPASGQPVADPQQKKSAKAATPENVLSRLSKKLSPEDARDLNNVILKSRQTQGGERVEKSAEQSKLEKRVQLGQAIVGLTKAGRTNMEKSGIVVPTDFAPGGTLNPTLAQTFFEIPQPQMQLLDKIQVIPMTSFNQEVVVMGLSQRTAVRLATNDITSVGPTTNPVNASLILHAADIDLLALIDNKMTLQYQGNLPGLENALTVMLGQNFIGQSEDLGINGTTDTWDGSTFTTLKEGWTHKAVTAATGGAAWRSITCSVGIGAGAITTTTGAWDAAISVLAANQPIYANQQNVFIISRADFELYEAATLAARKSDEPLIHGAQREYRGRTLIISDFMTPGHFIYTQLKNLVFGYVQGGSEGVRVQRIEVAKAMKIIMSIGVAYGFVDLDGAVVAQP